MVNTTQTFFPVLVISICNINFKIKVNVSERFNNHTTSLIFFFFASLNARKLFSINYLRNVKSLINITQKKIINVIENTKLVGNKIGKLISNDKVTFYYFD